VIQTVLLAAGVVDRPALRDQLWLPNGEQHR
jgi:hypothetical protein